MLTKRLIILFLAILYILHDMPMLGYRYPSVLYAFIIISLFLLLTFDIGFKSLLKLVPIFIIPLLDVFISSTNALSFFQGISGFLQSLILPILAIYIYEWNDLKMAKLIFLTFIGVNIITCFTTYNGCLMYPNASRDLATDSITSSPFYYLYLAANIGGINFIYNTVLISGLVIYTIKNFRYIDRGYILLPLCIIYLGLIFITLLAAEYTFSVLLFVSYVFLFYVRGVFSIKKFFVLGTFVILSFFVFKPLVSSSLKSVSEIVRSENIANRVYDLHLKLEGKHTQDSSDFDARKDRYVKSFEQFKNTPIGCWSFKGMGGHSFILDSLAKYGILGLILVILAYVYIYRYYLSPYKDFYIFGYGFYIFFLFIIMSVLNPHFFTNVIMFVFPLYVFIYQGDICDCEDIVEND